MFYKIVREVDGQLVSMCANDLFPSEYRVTYITNEFVRPRVDKTGLFVFQNLKDAEDYAYNIGIFGIQVWECEVENPRECKERGLINRIKQFWNPVYFMDSSRVYSVPTPKGTYICDAVKLIKEIY